MYDVCEELSQNFIDYAYAVNSDRAIPSIADGLKPVVRRILWDMKQLKANSNKAHIKCARVSGDTMGKYHPHGDSAIYDALVRLAQPFSMRYPLIDGHGNFGNIGGDEAAAARYTECRLEKLTEEGFLNKINEHILEMQPNYDETLTEPVLLPALFPNILCNPTQGIGLAMACQWLPHNLNDIVDKTIIPYLLDQEIDYKNIFPDFPTGGTIVNKDEVYKIYTTGKGKVIVEAKWREEERDGDRLVVFYELPYQVYLEPLIDKIKQQCLANNINNVLDVRNESTDKEIRVVLEIEKDTDIDHLIDQVFSYTDLRKNFNANQVGLVGKTPKLVNLDEVLEIYTNFHKGIIRRFHEYEFGVARTRIEILEGLLKALEQIEQIIKCIKESDSPSTARAKLENDFDFTESQAKAILDMKLSRLANLEQTKLKDELKEKIEYAAFCESVVNSQEKQIEILIDELRELVKKFGDSRRTDVIQKSIKKITKTTEKKEKPAREVVVSLNALGYLNVTPVELYKTKKDDIKTFKCSSKDFILLFSSSGKFYRIKVENITVDNKKGIIPASILKLEQNEKIQLIASMNIDEKHPYISFFTKNGLVKKSEKSLYVGSTQNLSGIKALTLNDGDDLVNIFETNGDYVDIISSNNKELIFNMEEVRVTGKTAKGVKSITLDENAIVKSVNIIDKPKDSKKIGKRAGKGKIINV